MQVAREIIDVAPGQPLLVLLANTSEKQEIIPKYMIIVKTLDKPQPVTPIKVSILEFEPDTVAAVHYEPTVDRDKQISRHKVVEKYDDEKL